MVRRHVPEHRRRGVTQLAKDDGLLVVADAAERDEELVRSFGADAVVRRGNGVAGRIRDVVPDGVDGVVDTPLLAIRDTGALAAVRPFSGDTERGIAVHQVWVREYRYAHQELDRLRRQAEEGVLTLRVAGVYPLERAGEGDLDGVAERRRSRVPVRSAAEGLQQAENQRLLPSGAVRFLIWRLPPESAGENPVGVHRTDTVDWVVVLSGEVTLVLGCGEEARLSTGDCLVQGGNLHHWRNVTTEPCVMAVFMVGAPRE
jgi:mannose-6-phosphate isomerase-like protein (cupin superfamily)